MQAILITAIGAYVMTMAAYFIVFVARLMMFELSLKALIALTLTCMAIKAGPALKKALKGLMQAR